MRIDIFDLILTIYAILFGTLPATFLVLYYITGSSVMLLLSIFSATVILIIAQNRDGSINNSVGTNLMAILPAYAIVKLSLKVLTIKEVTLFAVVILSTFFIAFIGSIILYELRGALSRG